ncbi:MAG TPA: DEAD/DEAH box helicase [Solirubrobacteraceae bacterium]|jgi:DEAD/DEAH box helicase domain-containing protein
MAVTREIEPWQELLDAGRADERLVREAQEFEKAPVLGDVPPLHPKLVDALRGMGVERLYSHQVEAVHAAMEGDFIVTTGTASGKSMCFNLPTLSHLLQEPSARALYLYPTKALAQDQARALNAFGLPRQIRPAIYDGDTAREERAAIRRRANVVLTNPDMLHVGILPNHRAWSDFLHRLDVVVVDEAHVYRGVFGSHVGNVLRRLRRMAPEARFFMASATIANPVELAERLTGVEGFTLVDCDGSPRARRRIAVWNPPLVEGGEDIGARRSALAEAADILVDLISNGARTICFIKSRKAVELTTKMVQDKLRDDGLAERIAPYRAGYTPQQRREIEARLVNGELLAVITTDALELGIDIGALDAAVVVTFPGTMASLRQMWGRAGRRGRGLAVYVAGEDALDQFLCREPDQLLERPVEAAILDYESEQIHLAHLLCAAHEAPLTPQDAPALGPRWQLHAEALEAQGLLRQVRGRFVLAEPEDYPASRVSLRSASPDSFAVVDVSSGELLGTVETARAFSTVHDGAVYLHLGRSYEVVQLDLESRRALVKPFGGDWYTQPKKETDTWIEQLLDRREVLGCTLSFGKVSVAETVLAYQRKRLRDHEVIDLQTLDLPTTEFSTQALWYELPDEIAKTDFPPQLLLGALHAAEHSQIAVLPLLAMCDRWDIGGLSTAAHQQTGGPTIFIYDGHPGGVGITRQAFLRFDELVTDAASLIRDCPCESGCPSCIQSPKCGNLNEPLSKRGSLELMVRMLRR